MSTTAGAGPSSSRTTTCTTTNAASSSSASTSRPTRTTMKPTLPNKPAKEYPVCRFFATPRGCFAGDKCRFLHGKAEPPREDKKTCRYFARGYCLRGESCWFRHVTDDGKEVGKSKQKEEPTVTETQRDDNKESEHEPEMCGICFDVPTVYGLLDGCSHIFCLSCIKMWRGGGQDSIPQQSQNHRQCPGCRQPTLRFITPSSQFYAEGTPKKIEVKKAYKLSMSKVPCKFFQESSPTNRLCPYGKDCYYLHENPDGTKYQFKHGAKASRRLWNQHQRRLNGQTSEPRFQRRPSWLGGPRGGPSLDLWEYLFEDFDTHGMYDWSDDDDLDDDDDLYDVVDWGVRPARSSIRDEQLNESLTNLFYLLQ